MPEQWVSVATAASHLNCHTRTIERRISSGKIPSRKGDDGQVQVCLDLPDMSDTPTDPILAVRELAQDQVSMAAGSASALVKFAQADADRVRTELSLVREEATRVRHSARLAWGSVALMSACICVAVGWTTWKITRTTADIATIAQKSQQIEAESLKLVAQRDAAIQEAQQSRLAQARSEGELAVMKDQLAQARHSLVSDSRPTTRPTGFIERIASIFADH